MLMEHELVAVGEANAATYSGMWKRRSFGKDREDRLNMRVAEPNPGLECIDGHVGSEFIRGQVSLRS